MENKKTTLITMSFTVELDDNEDNDELLDKVIDDESKDKIITFEGKDILFRYNKTTSFTLDPERRNCGICTICGKWTTDCCEKDPITKLCFGAKSDGKLICSDCHIYL
jgi:hypothetical protein